MLAIQTDKNSLHWKTISDFDEVTQESLGEYKMALNREQRFRTSAKR